MKSDVRKKIRFVAISIMMLFCVPLFSEDGQSLHADQEAENPVSIRDEISPLSAAQKSGRSDQLFKVEFMASLLAYILTHVVVVPAVNASPYGSDTNMLGAYIFRMLTFSVLDTGIKQYMYYNTFDSFKPCKANVVAILMSDMLKYLVPDVITAAHDHFNDLYVDTLSGDNLEIIQMTGQGVRTALLCAWIVVSSKATQILTENFLSIGKNIGFFS